MLNQMRVPYRHSVFQMWAYRGDIETFQGISRAELIETPIEQADFLVSFLAILFNLFRPAEVISNPHS